MITAFLDANVLFSAAYRPQAGLRRLWELRGVRLVTSAYAIAEARRNLERGDAITRLEALLADMRIVPECGPVNPPHTPSIRPKDQPILAAAVSIEADYLITGDVRDFGRFFGQRIAGVMILPPAEFLCRIEKPSL